MQEAEPLAKSLRLVLALHAETELCVQRPESGFDTAQRFVAIEWAARRHVVGSRRLDLSLVAYAFVPAAPARDTTIARAFLIQVERGSVTFLRPDIPVLLDGENLDLVVAHQDNIARGFAD